MRNTPNEQRRPISILHVEDSSYDAELVLRGLRGGSGVSCQVTLASDGEQALELLKAHSPDLIILDLNLPRVSGPEVLAEVRSNPAHCQIPVVILTSSNRAKDIEESYAAGANSYVCKPLLLEDYSRVIASIRDYWTETSMLPVVDWPAG